MKKKKSLVLIILLTFSLLAGCSNASRNGASGTSTSTPTTPNEATPQTQSAADDKPIELSYAFFAPANTFPAVQMQKWADELHRRTNGKVKTNLFPGGTLLTAENMFDGVMNGVADIGLAATSYEAGRFPLFSISDMPSGYPNGEVASQVVFELFQLFPPEGLKDFKIITAFATEPNYIQSKKRSGSLEEIKGQTLRISGASTPVLSVLGANPVGMSTPEALEAIQTGIIDGHVSSRETLLDFKFAEKLKYVTDYPLAITSFVAIMKKEKWDSLPADVQLVIDKLAPEMSKFAGATIDEQVKKSLEWAMAEHNVEILSLTPEEKAKWDEIYRELQESTVEELEAKGLPAREFLQKTRELVEKYSQ